MPAQSSSRQHYLVRVAAVLLVGLLLVYAANSTVSIHGDRRTRAAETLSENVPASQPGNQTDVAVQATAPQTHTTDTVELVTTTSWITEAGEEREKDEDEDEDEERKKKEDKQEEERKREEDKQEDDRGEATTSTNAAKPHPRGTFAGLLPFGLTWPGAVQPPVPAGGAGGVEEPGVLEEEGAAGEGGKKEKTRPKFPAPPGSAWEGARVKRFEGRKTEYAETAMGATFASSLRLHRAFFEANCTLRGCPDVKHWVDTGPPDGRWYSGDKVARSSINGEVCTVLKSKPGPGNASAGGDPPEAKAVALRPWNYVARYREELARMRALLQCSAAFAFLLCNDGERDAIKGSLKYDRLYKGLEDEKRQKGLATEEGAREQISSDLRAALLVQDSRYIIGLPIPSCLEGHSNDQKSGGGSVRFLNFFVRKGDGWTPESLLYLRPFQSLSYSTVFSHRGGREAMAFMKGVAGWNRTVVVTNHGVHERAQRKKLAWAERIEAFPSNLAQHWQGQVREEHLKRAAQLAHPGGRIFLFALGPVGKILIHHMWKANPNNSYVDIGSMIDGLTGNTDSRGWLQSRCHKIGKVCSEVRYTVKHDMGRCGGCEGSGRCVCETLPLVPHIAGKKRDDNVGCKNKLHGGK